MKLKTKYDVFGKVYKIKREDLGPHYHGVCSPDTSTIVIDKNDKNAILQSTFLHEIGHAIFHRVGLNQTIPSEVEEIIVENISNWITENFRLVQK